MDARTMTSLLLLLLLGLCYAKFDYENNVNETSVDASATEDISTTILRMNSGSAHLMMEGDLLIPRNKNAMKCWKITVSCRWPKSTNGMVEIPFVISKDYESSEKQEILDAMEGIESKTCIRFIPRFRQRAYLSIEPRFGCASLMGYTRDKQVVSLQRFGCIQRGIIQHELLHAMGFAHEQNRSDRDKYVRIIWDNIHSYVAYNFHKRDTNNLNTPYDYSSVMHYGRTAFAKERKTETIIPIPDASVPIGQRDGVSDIDVLKINRLYKCENYIA